MIEAGDENDELVREETPTAVRTVTTAMPVIMDIFVIALSYPIDTCPAYCKTTTKRRERGNTASTRASLSPASTNPASVCHFDLTGTLRAIDPASLTGIIPGIVVTRLRHHVVLAAL
jgi:hypothetical protein